MSEAVVTRNDIDKVIGMFRDFIKDVDIRFNKFETTIESIKHDTIDLKASHDHLLNIVDAFLARIDRYETELAARDNQFERLLSWARKVSEKTGIPLENL